MKLFADHSAELVEEITPCPVSEFGRTLGRRHDVREQHSREYPVGLGCDSYSRDELSNLLHDGFDVSHVREVVLA